MRNQFHLTATTTDSVTSKRFVTVMHVDRTDGSSVNRPEPPSTPRRQIQLRNIQDRSTLDETLMDVEQLIAEGGIALRLGDDFIMWKEEEEAPKVRAAGTSSTKPMVVKQGFFSDLYD